MTHTAFHKEEDDTVLTGLQQAAGDQTPPSGPEGPAASQGALGAPAPAGENSAPAFADRGLVEGEGIRNRYIDMWDAPETDDKDRDATVEELEKALSSGGSGVVAKTNETISNIMKQGDMPGLSLLMDWGWTPESERSSDSSAFSGQKNLGSEFTVQEGEMGALGGDIEPSAPSADKPKWDRKRMGGFLMEFGLRMLASDRDAAGAFGEAGLGTMQARGERKKTKAAEDLATSERERKQRREDEGDLHKREKAARDKRAEGRAVKDEERKAEKAEREGLTRITMPDGKVEYGKIVDGVVTRKDGTEIKGIDPSQQSAESMSAVERQEIGLRAKIDTATTKALQDRIRKPPRGDEDLYAIQNAKSSKEKKRLLKKYNLAKFNELKGSEDAEANPLELEF